MSYHIHIMRISIDLSASHLDALDMWCRRDGISRAVAIRRAIAAAVGPQVAKAQKLAYGLCRDRGVDGLAWERSIRAEWDVTPIPGCSRTSRGR